MKQVRDPEQLREALKASGFSHRELARLAKCSHSTPGKLLGGARVNDGAAERIARALRIPLNNLFEPSTSNTEQRSDNRQAER